MPLSPLSAVTRSKQAPSPSKCTFDQVKTTFFARLKLRACERAPAAAPVRVGRAPAAPARHRSACLRSAPAWAQHRRLVSQRLGAIAPPGHHRCSHAQPPSPAFALAWGRQQLKIASSTCRLAGLPADKRCLAHLLRPRRPLLALVACHIGRPPQRRLAAAAPRRPVARRGAHFSARSLHSQPCAR